MPKQINITDIRITQVVIFPSRQGVDADGKLTTVLPQVEFAYVERTEAGADYGVVQRQTFEVPTAGLTMVNQIVNWGTPRIKAAEGI